MTTVRVRGVLFDMDGVLVRSEGSVERSWEKFALRHNMPIAETVRAALGRRSVDTVRELLPHVDAERENRYVEDWECEDNEGLVVLPGVLEMIRQLPPGAWTIVTSATKRLALSRLGHGGVPLPERFVTGDDVARGKPNPEPYAKGAELLGLPPSECLVVEDAPAGVAAGKAAGCKVLAVARVVESERLRAADWQVESLADVKVQANRDGGLQIEFEPLSIAAIQDAPVSV